MKNNIYIGIVMSILTFLSFSNNSPIPIKFKNSFTTQDTIKQSTEQSLDSTALQLELFQENAHASYYHDKFTGKKTASGAIFNNNELTCAHKKLPFGTKLKVTSIKTGKSVIVTVTDRGPFAKDRHIDLSKKAFMSIAPNKYGGHIRVNIEIIKQ